MDSMKKIREKRIILQSAIAHELRQFEKETGMRVGKISYTRYDEDYIIANMHIEIKI